MYLSNLLNKPGVLDLPIKYILKTLNLSEQYVPPDGHCQYNSVINCLKATHNTLYSVKSLRNTVAKHLLNKKKHYKHFITGNFNSYINGVRNNQWGDHITLQVLSNILNCKFIILSPNISNNKTNISIVNTNNTNNTNEYTHLLILQDHHYTSTIVLKNHTFLSYITPKLISQTLLLFLFLLLHLFK